MAQLEVRGGAFVEEDHMDQSDRKVGFRWPNAVS